jgi:hypothetical protein
MAGLVGLEPTTLGLEGRCSIQLSYNPLELKTNTTDDDNQNMLFAE